MRPLRRAFFDRPAEQVAPSLLGMVLARRRHGVITRCLIREAEAYVGAHDRASHAFRGQTARNAAMFGPAGRWYVYRVYGLRWMLNVVTGPGCAPTAVLIRAAGPAAGPALLCKSLGIDGRWNGLVIDRSCGLWIEQGPVEEQRGVASLARVGVSYAGPYCARRRLRFLHAAFSQRKAGSRA
jgi:DNA-3-methyladenine glycosylase